VNASGGSPSDGRVSRRRYEREKTARREAEALLEAKSRELWEVNEQLTRQTANLEDAVRWRTEELQTAKALAETASAAKSGFLAMISHEIRTPLNGVLGMATVLAESDLPPDQQQMANVILQSGRVLLDLLNDVLDLSKIEAGKMEMERRPFDLAEWCRGVEALFAARAAEKHLIFAVTLETAPSGRVVSDPTRLQQVLANLVSNALKFTEEGGVHARVAAFGDRLYLTVDDSGPGVPEDKRDALFEAFVQTDTSITRKFGGTGLGLAISRQICRILGGDLTFAPRVPHGARFEAWVPLEIDRADRDTRAPSADPEQAARVLTDHPWRILVAEDSMTNQKVLRLLLRPYGLELEMVPNGAEAVERHCAAPFDLILMDVNMPQMDGLEAAGLIRASEQAHDLPRVPIIALTANAMTHQVADYLRQGIDAHVAKPVKRDVLVARMAHLLPSRPAAATGP